jgi:hypothetical protein
MTVLLQVQAAIPPGYRVQFGGPVEEDRPRLPDGSTPRTRVDNNGSLASPHLHDYARAMVRDLVRAYPEADGLRIDWPEYPPYSLDGAFFDFGPHAEAAAARLGRDFGAMREAAGALRARLLGGLSPTDLTMWTERDGGRFRLLQALVDAPALRDWLAFKADLASGIVATFRAALDEAAPGRMLVAGAFPPPLSILSGFSFRRAGAQCDAVMAKLFTMHWAMMVRGWGDALAAANPALPRSSTSSTTRDSTASRTGATPSRRKRTRSAGTPRRARSATPRPRPATRRSGRLRTATARSPTSRAASRSRARPLAAAPG